MTPKAPILLIDGDELLHTTLAALEKETDWGNDVWGLSVNRAEAIAAIDRRFDGYIEAFKPACTIMAFTGPGTNWRKTLVDPTYKAARAKTRKPMTFAQLKEMALEGVLFGTTAKAVTRATLEADDILGILATKPVNRGKTVIISQDKDFLGVPGFLFRGEWGPKEHMLSWEHSGALVIKVDKAEADLWHLTQTLAGDVTDGYPGCPSIGAVTGKDLLEKGLKFLKTKKVLQRGKRQGETEVAYERVASDSPWETVVSCFEKAGLTEADALKQARLARILRWEDWDQKNQEVKLWTP